MVNPIHLFTIKEQSTHSNPTMHHDHLLKITLLEFLDKIKWLTLSYFRTCTNCLLMPGTREGQVIQN